MTAAPSMGLVVNPVAGMGGRVGLHGTDGAAFDAALSLGAQPVAHRRAERALSRLAALLPDLRVVTVGGPMGEHHLPAGVGWQVEIVGRPGPVTSAADTRGAVRQMLGAGVDLVLFVGGDGTARDVLAEVGPVLPILGVPAGVKMHSGVFSPRPEPAGETAARYLAAPDRVGTREVEIVDVVSADALGAGGPQLFGTARVPAVAGGVQAAKARHAADDEAALVALGASVAAGLQPGVLYLLGPGTSVAQVNRALGLPASPLGVDVVRDGQLLARDAGEQELLDLLAGRPPARLLLGVVGGQGFLLGRGNQQLSPAVLRAVGPENIQILAATGKLASLAEPVLHVDLDDPGLAAELAGYRTVQTAPGRRTVLRILPPRTVEQAGARLASEGSATIRWFNDRKD